MSNGQIIFRWLEGLWSLLLSIVQDQLSGICDDLRLSIIDSVFGDISPYNPYLQEISATIHGLIGIGQAVGGLVNSLIPLASMMLILKGITSLINFKL